MKIGLGIGIPFIRNYVSSIVFDPSKLFTGSTNGVWYDPSDITTLYRDAAGTQPVTAVEQPVGLMLDKSKGLVLKPELVTNGTFDSSINGWTTNSNGSGSSVWIENSGNGAAKITNISGQATQFSQALAVTAGKTYQITANITYISGSISGNVSVRTSINASTSSNLGGQTLNAATNTGVSFYYLALSTTTVYVSSLAFTSACSYSLDNISVRELPGNHAFNSSGNSANFPVLSARVNLLTKTEQFDDAVWVKGKVTTTSGKITPNTETNYHNVNEAVTYAASGYTAVIEAKADGYEFLQVLLATTGATSYVEGIFNLSGSGVVENTSRNVNWTGTRSIQLLPDGYYRCTVTVSAATASSGFFEVGVMPTNNPFPQFAGDGTKGILVRKADLRVTNDALDQPAYQRVNTSTDYDTVGFKPYLRFNGTNQWLQTNSIDFSYTDKMFVSAGVRKLSDAAAGIVAELSAAAVSNAGSFYFAAPLLTTTSGNFAFYSRGAAAPGAAAQSATTLAPISAVVTGIGDIAGDLMSIRTNGVVGTNQTADQGTGNFGNYPLYIGARAGSSLWFNGRLYSLIVAGKLANAVEITETEKYVNGKTAAY